MNGEDNSVVCDVLGKYFEQLLSSQQAQLEHGGIPTLIDHDHLVQSVYATTTSHPSE
jgi:hypothetical protein